MTADSVPESVPSVGSWRRRSDALKLAAGQLAAGRLSQEANPGFVLVSRNHLFSCGIWTFLLEASRKDGMELQNGTG